MFSGLIEAVGTIAQMNQDGAVMHLTVHKNSAWSDVCKGDSVAVNGVCLTVVDQGRDTLSFDVIDTTLAVTSLGSLQQGATVNLERALSIQARLDGHICAGHVDCLGQVEAIMQVDGSYHLKIGFSEDWAAHVLSKGSVALDGISLTIVNCDRQSLEVAIIPHTLSHTNLKEKEVGDPINIEFDYLGKYVLSYLKHRES